MVRGKEKSNASLRRDPSWKYSVQVDIGGAEKTYVYLKCNFCDKVVKGGVTRMKEHLSGSHKNVAPCANVPDKVKEEISAYMKKSTTAKHLQQEQFDDRVEHGFYYGSESGKGSSSTIHCRGARGPMDQYMVNPGEDRGQTQMMPAAGTREGRRQVLDFAAFPELKFDFPIFCANIFTTSTLNIIVLDLNPLYDATLQRDYKEKYYRSLMPLYQKYAELLPWGDKITSESLKFFSPIVIWSKINSTPQNYEVLYATFKDYFKAWLVSMELAVEAVNDMQTVCNCEAQHRYLAWRAEKDPGHPLLKRLIGENLAREMIRHFLFEGVDSLGTKTFLDYFPEYHCEDGSINHKRSIIGKAYKTRPWDAGGEFIGSKAS
ncbi:hypothetical protein M5K25_007147 [Dendrobium thyrsiflorum]|uniref:BED-type domain-containing protein n=1 Tax=Dendrobium thyrsiflorum TaxID=117978 RepID=A0ABD0VD49_DENTH